MKYICPKCNETEDFKSFHQNNAWVDAHKTVVIVTGYCDNCGTELQLSIIIAEINEVVLA